MSESPFETLEKAIVLHLIRDRGLTSLGNLEMHTEFNASKGDEARLFMKTDRNPKNFLETRNGRVVSQLTSRSVCIILSSLV